MRTKSVLRCRPNVWIITYLCLVAARPLASSADTPLDVYGRLPTLEDWALSPDGTKAANVQTKGDERYVVIRTLPGSQLLGGSRIGDEKVRSIRWLDDDDVLIEVSKTTDAPSGYLGPRQELAQLLFYKVSKQKLASLNILDAAWIVSGAPIIRETSGGAVLFVSGSSLVRGGIVSGLMRYNVTDGSKKVLQSGHKYPSQWLMDANGDAAGEVLFKYDEKTWDLMIPQAGHMNVVASGSATIDWPVILGFSPAGDAIWVQLAEKDAAVWRPLSLKDGSWGKAMEPLGEPFVDRKSGKVVAAVRDGEAIFFDNELQAHWDAVLRAFPKERVDLISSSDDFSKLLVRVFGSPDGYVYALYDWYTHHAYILGKVYADLAAIAPVKAISYSAADGLTLKAYLTLPSGKAASNLPLVVLPHGGPAAADSDDFNWWAQALAAQGYAVLQPNFRGSNLGFSFIAKGFGEFGRKMQTDLSDGVRYLADQGTIDPKRVCIAGASYGGYAALAGITLQPEIYRCAVSVAGLSDLKSLLKWTNSRQTEFNARHGDNLSQRYWDRFMGISGPNDPTIAAISPIEHVGAVQGPVLLIHGKDDTVVPYEQSDVMATALKRAGKSVEFVTLKREDHWLSRSDTRLQMLDAAVMFLRAHNPPD